MLNRERAKNIIVNTDISWGCANYRLFSDGGGPSMEGLAKTEDLMGLLGRYF